ncbi:hypothetical protein [Alteromonas lipolytica]|uniref:DUF4034 domain-containing protein n=1 Tax=Alteromonas lipolytica TaxID=1856405 RepID=A0A1E8FIR0_9ALTE|nr:hypothetical protein [Alteromonas lipolytica]OFI35498.1 hypothetical protein BFC17_12080 [Alteromonas lipolytica]GGF76762.1 hypothetical protein GCM10011338_31180 [Alteromonas lipolytica]
MKLLFSLGLLCCLVLLNGCVSTTSKSARLEPQEAALVSKVEQYPNDSLALRELVEYQLQLFDESPDFELFSRLEKNLLKGLEIAPSERFFAYHYYVINLKLAFVEGRYEQKKWQAFYQQHPFLATLDLAPPVYVDYLLKEPTGSEKVAILQQSLRTNPFFMNAYLELARHYYTEDKTALATYLMMAARRHNEESVEVLSDLVHYRTTQLSEAMCHADIRESVPAVLEDARTLTRMVPDEAFFQSQLAEVFRLNRQYPLAIFAAAKAAELDKSYTDYLLELYLWDTRLDKVMAFTGDAAQQRDVMYVLPKVYASIAALNWQEAAKQASLYSQLEDAEPYGVLYGAYSYGIMGNTAEREKLLKLLDSTISMSDWHRNMLAFARGSIDEAQLMAVADDRCKQSEALFVAALQHFENHQTEKANTYWQQIIDLGVMNYFEFGTARNRVKALKKAAQ